MESGIKPQISRNEYSNSVNKAIKDDYSSINTQHRAMRPKKVPEHQIPNGLIPKKQSGVMEIDISFPSLVIARN